jgi:uncharacterized repeat protein (TIGR03803 family)
MQINFSSKVVLLGVMLSVAVRTMAQTCTVLHSFMLDKGGSMPTCRLVLSGGALYGTTYLGESTLPGIVFKINTDGTGYTQIHGFTHGKADGAAPTSGVTLSGGVLYGTTYNGGVSYKSNDAPGWGTVFKINNDGTGFTILHSFTNDPNGDGGIIPVAGLVESGGTLFGTTILGGGTYANGTVFKLNTDGSGFAVLHSFSGLQEGAVPSVGLVISGDTLYGTTGTISTVFKVKVDGSGFGTLYHFNGLRDGDTPGQLTLSGNSLYGTANKAGTSHCGTLFKLSTDGTGFVVLHQFTGGSDSQAPACALLLSGDVLYGTTFGKMDIPGDNQRDEGTVFKINTDGSGFATIYRFRNGNDGAHPSAGLVMSGQTLYGTTTGVAVLASGLSLR